MSGDDGAFLRAIIDNPDDDLPRLVYADYLDERGDPRGEFIRVQVERATLPADDDRQVGLALRERGLLLRHGGRWRLPYNVRGQEFRRGFVEAVDLAEFGQFRQYGEAMFAAAPIRDLRGTLTGPEIAELAGRVELRRLHTLTLHSGLWLGQDFRALADSEHTGGLVTLRLPDCGLGPAEFRLLAESPAFPRLQSLDLSDNRPTDAGAEHLAGSRHLSGLRSLVIRGGVQPEAFHDYAVRLHAAGATAIARSNHLVRLTHLDLSLNEIGDGGLAALADSPGSASLESLCLAGCDVGATGDVAVERLVESRHVRRLRHIDLRDNLLGGHARRLLRERFGTSALL